MLEDQPQRPANMHRVVAINQGRLGYTRHKVGFRRLTCSEVEACWKKGSVILDSRPAQSFGGGHIPGAYNIQVSSPNFEQSVGWIFPEEEALVLVVEARKDATKAAHKLAFLGLDRLVTGFLLMEDWLDSELTLNKFPQIEVAALKEALQQMPLKVLDVREQQEWRQGHIDGAFNQSFRQLRSAQLPFKEDTELAVVCEGGIRSSTACSILHNRGFLRLYNVSGGMEAWRSQSFPVERTQQAVGALERES